MHLFARRNLEYLKLALELQHELVREMGTVKCNHPVDVRLHLQLLRLQAATSAIEDAKTELGVLKELTGNLGVGREALQKIIDQFPALQH